MSNKFNELQSRLTIDKPDIVAITEVNCKFGGSNIEFNIDGYKTIQNTTNSQQRGVCIFVKSDLQAYKDDALSSSSFLESIWCRISLTNKDCLLFGVVYRSPNSNIDNFNNLRSLLTQATNTGVSHLLIAGDFNMPHINWNTLSTTSNCGCDGAFLSLLDDLFITQHVTFPTRYRNDQTPSILDLILSTDKHEVTDLTSLPPLGKSDHVVISFEFLCYHSIECVNVPKYLYGRGDYRSMTHELLDTNWAQLFEGQDMESMWLCFHTKLLNLIDKYIPVKTASSKPKPKWLDWPTLKAIKLKHKTWNTYKVTKRHVDYISYSKCRNNATAAVKHAKSTFETKLARDIQHNPNLFWKYVRSNTKVRVDVDKLLKDDGTLTCSDHEVANHLNDFFTSVYTDEPTSEVPTLPDRSNGSTLQHTEITHEDVLHQLNRLKPNKSCGPDKCHPQVLKNVKDGLIVPLYYLYNKSLEEATLLLSWKEATITPIFKKGDRKLPNNYRPISLTAIFCRLLEAIIRDKIMSYFASNNFFSNEQFGFRSKRSCEAQLLTIMEHWSRVIEDGTSIDVIYLDFQKAFDKVPHRRLMTKLKAYGIQGNVLNWLENFCQTENRESQFVDLILTGLM